MKNRPNPNATFISIKIDNKYINAYVDTGATICLADPKIPLKWKKLNQPLKISVADTSIHEIWYRAEIVEVYIQKYRFIIPSVYKHNSGMDFVLGNNFLKLYHPFTQELNYIKLQAPKD